VHNSSSMIGLAISSVSVVPMPEVNSSPRKLTAPRGLFETVSKNISRRGPQRTLLSVFRVRRASRFIKEEYGNRVYSVSFSIDRRMVVVDSGFGVDVIDLVKRTSTFYDQGYMPNFAIKKCEK
ncbi:hypothetical protein, partial [Burkholderia vietnamiensis]